MKKIIYLMVCAFSLGGVSQSVLAQIVVQAASAKLQPQIGRDDKGYSTCGIHAVVLNIQGQSVEVYDFSINIRANMHVGLIKAGKMQTSTKEMLANKSLPIAVQPAPINFWIAKEAEGSALRLQKIIPVDTPGYILAGADLVKTYDILLGMANGERIQFATRYKSQRLDTVVSFGTALQDVEFQPLITCLNGVTDRLQNEADSQD